MTTSIRRAGITAAVMLAVALSVVAAQNVIIDRYFPNLSRLTTDFSPVYLDREMNSMARSQHVVILLGDSVVWGYDLEPSQTASAILAARGCNCWNLSFKAGSPPNDFALMRLILDRGIRPAAVILQVNQKVLSETDSAYNTLHPTISVLALALLSPADRRLLTPPRPRSAVPAVLDSALSSTSLLYAMRSDIRETVFGRRDAAAFIHVSASQFEGAYDLTPLNGRNVGVHFLQETAAMLHDARVPTIAFMTPTNHTLLHDYIDTPEYKANGAYLRKMLAREGVRVVDLDSAFSAREFLDNDHLTAPAQRRLASMLARALPVTLGRKV